MSEYEKLGVHNPQICKYLTDWNFTVPTEVQKGCIPKILAGKEVVACAETGSGKTAAFLIPIVQLLSEKSKSNYAVIVSPTRELAEQIGTSAKELCKLFSYKVLVITGGKDYVKLGTDIKDLFHIIVATPGRLAHMIRDNESICEFKLNKVRYLVIDEADRMLEDNFGDDIKVIFEAVGKSAKKLLFTATLNGATRDVVEYIRKDAEQKGRQPIEIWESEAVSKTSKFTTVSTLKEYYALVKSQIIEAVILYIVQKWLSSQPNSLIMVFASKWRQCELIYYVLKRYNVDVRLLHGGLSNNNRESSLKSFRSKNARVIIASNVLARGLDIVGVDLVINYGIPDDPKTYVHRVGRTARSGKIGTAISIDRLENKDRLLSIQKYIDRDIELYSLSHDDWKIIMETYMEVYTSVQDIEQKQSDYQKSKKTSSRSALKRKL